MRRSCGSARRDRRRPATPVDRLQKPMSLRPSVGAARCSRVLTSILYLMAVMLAGRDLGADAGQIGPPRHQRLLGPSRSHGRRTGRPPPAVRVGATRTSPRAMSTSSVERDGDGVARLRRVPVRRRRSRSRRRAWSGRTATTTTGSPHRDLAGRDGSGIAAEIEVRPVDPLHREAERLAPAAWLDLDDLEIVEQGRAAIPRRIGGRLGDVVAEARRDRDRHDRREAELRRRTRA